MSLFWSYYLSLIITSVVLLLCVAISIFTYTKIFLTLRQHQAQIQEHVQQGQPNEQALPSPLNIAKYKKTVSSVAWVPLALVACYFPFGIAVALRTWQIVLNTFFGLSLTLNYLNSSLNPLLYCWKINEVREAVKDTIRQCFCISV